MNQDIKSRIENLMEKNGIETQIELLHRVFRELNSKNYYEEAEKQKSNFSNMLNGTRDIPLKWYLPLEKTLNTSINYILNGSEQANTNFFVNKGIRYGAFLNNYEKFKELDNEFKDDGDILTSYDEFNKCILDYIIEFDSLNGLIYLTDKYQIKYNLMANCIESDKFSCRLFYSKTIPIIKLICKSDEANLFNKMFDAYELVFGGYYDKDKSIYFKKEVLELLANTNKIFNSLLTDKEVSVFQANKNLVSSQDADTVLLFANPLLNLLLEYMLTSPSRYKEKINIILDYALKFNKKQLEHIDNKFKFELKIDSFNIIKNGYTSYGNVILSSNVYSQDISQEIVKKLEQNENLVNQIKVMDYSDILGRRCYKVDENYIYKRHSKNPYEYEIYEKLKNKKIPGMLEFIGESDGIDKFKKVNGECNIRLKRNNFNQLLSVVRFLKNFHKEFENERFNNNNLCSQNILFENDEVVGVIDWSKCTKVDANNLDDLYFVILNWSELKNKFCDYKSVINQVSSALHEYFEDNVPATFFEDFENYITNKIPKNLEKDDDIFEYEGNLWSLAMLGLIKKLKGGENNE